MPYFLQCRNKGCGEETEALLNDKNQVICAKCSKEITDVNDFVKRSMKDLGQVSKKRGPEPGAVKCASCGEESLPVKLAGSKEYSCGKCKKQLNFSPVYKHFLDMKK